MSRIQIFEATGGSFPFDADLILRYRLDEGSGTTVADSANSNDATLSGASWIAGPTGAAGGLGFDGTNDYVQSDANVTYSADVITIAAHVRNSAWSGGSGVQTLWESSASGNQGNANTFVTNNEFGGIENYITGDIFTQRRETDPSDPTDSTWVHLAIIYDNSTAGGDITYYEDASAVTLTLNGDTKTGTANFAANILNIGARNAASAFCGFDIADFCVYNRALTGAEITTLEANPGRA